MGGVDRNRGVRHSTSCILYAYDWGVVDDEVAPYLVETSLKAGIRQATGADKVGAEICPVVCRVE